MTILKHTVYSSVDWNAFSRYYRLAAFSRFISILLFYKIVLLHVLSWLFTFLCQMYIIHLLFQRIDFIIIYSYNFVCPKLTTQMAHTGPQWEHSLAPAIASYGWNKLLMKGASDRFQTPWRYPENQTPPDSLDWEFHSLLIRRNVIFMWHRWFLKSC